MRLDYESDPPDQVPTVVSQSAAAFAASEAIKGGEWDRFLAQIGSAVRERQMVLDHTRKPTIPLPPGQVWAWMHGPGTPHWEPRGTGALVPDVVVRGEQGRNMGQ